MDRETLSNIYRSTNTPSNQANIIITLSALQIVALVFMFTILTAFGIRKHNRHEEELANRQMQIQTQQPAASIASTRPPVAIVGIPPQGQVLNDTSTVDIDNAVARKEGVSTEQ